MASRLSQAAPISRTTVLTTLFSSFDQTSGTCYLAIGSVLLLLHCKPDMPARGAQWFLEEHLGHSVRGWTHSDPSQKHRAGNLAYDFAWPA